MSETDMKRRSFKFCKECYTEFRGGFTQEYCSEKCRTKKYGRKKKFEKLNSVTLGALQEHRVIVYFLGKGYEVFKACSPSCSSDLIIRKNNLIKTVEVRTFHFNKDKTPSYPKHKIRSNIMALVNHKGRVLVRTTN